MKSFEWLTTQVAIVLIAAMLIAGGILIGVPVWLVATNRSPPVLLSAPIALVLGGIASAAVAWSRSLMKLPPAPDGTEWKLAPSIHAPAHRVTEAELAGEVVHYEFEPERPVTTSLPPTAPATPDSKRRTLR